MRPPLIACGALLVLLNRETSTFEAILRYYGQKGSELVEINPAAFPRPIAVQNLWSGSRYFVGTEPGQLDWIEITRDLDTSNIYFRGSLTARVWNHLTTGQQEYQCRNDVKRELLDAYIQSNKPIKLTYSQYFQPAAPDGNAGLGYDKEARSAHE